MGMSPKGKLIYGYALGGSEDGPLIAEINEDGEWLTDWAVALAMNPGRTREDPNPFWHLAEVLKAAGLDVGRSHDPQPLKLINYGHLEYGHCVALVTYEVETEWSEVVAVDLPALEIMRQAQGWDELLSQAVTALGITPVEIANTGNRWDHNAPRVPVPPRWMVVAQYI